MFTRGSDLVSLVRMYQNSDLAVCIQNAPNACILIVEQRNENNAAIKTRVGTVVGCRNQGSED